MRPRIPALSTLIISLTAVTPAALLLASTPAWANTELDRRYALETVGLLRSVDNMDGLFSDYVVTAYKDYFARQSRFVLQDLSRSDELLTRSKLPYAKIIQDNAILAQLSRSTRSQTLIRTKVYKEGPQYRFNLEWLHAPSMDLLATGEFVLQDLHDGKGFSMQDLRESLQAALDAMIRKLPFQGAVTGRDNNSVTINLGSTSGLKPGDIVVVGTIDDAKRHPLLKEVVDWTVTPVGRVSIDQVDEKIAFGQVVEETEGHKVARYQKVTQIIPKSVPAAPLVVKDDSDEGGYRGPTIGWLGGELWGGGLSRQIGNAAGTTGRTGGGLLFGAKVESNIWLTRETFADLHLGWGTSGYGQKDLATAASSSADTLSSTSAQMTHFRLSLGYSYLVNRDMFGPKAWAKLGYQSTLFMMPVNAAELVDSVTFSSLLVGIGGQLPIRDQLGAMMTLDFGVFPGVSETGGINGSVSSSSTVLFFLGGYYHYTPRLTVRAGIEVNAFGAQFSNGSSLAQKTVTFAPALLYYF